MTDEIKTETTAVSADVKADVTTLKSKIAALEADAKTWYEKHVTLIAAIAGAAVGALAVLVFTKL